MNVLHMSLVITYVLVSMVTTCVFVECTKSSVRRGLEKDVLKHTISYLRVRLIRCLGDVGPYRIKRRTDLDESAFPHVTHAVDMDILSNTQNYLMDRLVACYEHAGTNEILDPPHPHDNVIRPVHHLDSAALKLAATSLQVTPRTPVVSQHTTTVTTTTEKGLPQDFDINGRKVSCQSAYVAADSGRLVCRDLRVDAGLRLPNADVCYDYDPDNWRPLSAIQSRTFKVLDLKGFCTALAFAAKMRKPVRDVKVSWDCGHTEPRLMWVDGGWAGFVDDNGFLHDIACYYGEILSK